LHVGTHAITIPASRGTGAQVPAAPFMEHTEVGPVHGFRQNVKPLGEGAVTQLHGHDRRA
jgi:hypothetical protein